MSNRPTKHTDLPPASIQLLGDIRKLIEETRAAVAATVNAGLTMLYWRIGKRVNEEILRGDRADYGRQILATLSQELTQDYGSGFSYSALTRMVKFAECFADPEIVATLSRQLSWSHVRELLPLDRPLQREFYAEMCRVERWSVRTLRRKIDSMLYERTALSRKPEAVAKAELEKLRDEDRMSPDLVFKDPYILDFLGLKDRYLEKDLEDAILREIECFLLELGEGFTFVSRRKRIQIDSEDFYLDLLFYHRKLRRLIAIELKLGRFKAAYKGQMELYLRWLAKHETEPGEASPLGLILCAEGEHGQIELLELGKSGIHVAQYLTELPPKDVLKRKLHDALARSRMAIENRSEDASPQGKMPPKAPVKEFLPVRQEKKREKPAAAKRGKAGKRKKKGGE
jgi:predicted nuclease of restriction endonuclease-like (RecB) superfamily